MSNDRIELARRLKAIRSQIEFTVGPIRWVPESTTLNFAGQGSLIGWRWHGPCNDTGEIQWHRTRSHWVPADATDDYIVRIWFKAALEALEHEARERFFYKGVRVFDPHDPTSTKRPDQAAEPVAASNWRKFGDAMAQAVIRDFRDNPPIYLRSSRAPDEPTDLAKWLDRNEELSKALGLACNPSPGLCPQDEARFKYRLLKRLHAEALLAEQRASKQDI